MLNLHCEVQKENFNFEKREETVPFNNIKLFLAWTVVFFPSTHPSTLHNDWSQKNNTKWFHFDHTNWQSHSEKCQSKEPQEALASLEVYTLYWGWTSGKSYCLSWNTSNSQLLGCSTLFCTAQPNAQRTELLNMKQSLGFHIPSCCCRSKSKKSYLKICFHFYAVVQKIILFWFLEFALHLHFYFYFGTFNLARNTNHSPL